MVLISMLAALTMLLITLVLYQYTLKDKQVVSERMNRYTQATSSSGWSSPSYSHEQPKSANWMEVVKQLGQYARKAPKAHYFDRRMMQAGIPLRGSEFIVLSVGISLIAGLLGTILTQGQMLKGIVIGAVVYFAALFYVHIRIAQRIKAFNNQLGDALSMMANSLRSGFSFLQMVDMVSKEMKPPISEEFAQLLREMNLGITTEEALDNLTERVGSNDLELVVTAVLIQRQVGGNLAQILDNIALTIRQRLQMKREVRALTAQGRLSGWIVGLLPIFMAIFLTITKPNYINQLYTHPFGQFLILAGLISQLLGGLLIRKIIDIDV